MKIEQMNVAQIEYDNWGEASTNSNSDWAKANKHCTFSHSEACEFIFYIGSITERTYPEYLRKFKDIGFSVPFIVEIENAQDLGFNYLCFYA